MQKEQLERYVKQAKGGDHEAFEKLYKETYSRAWFVARGVLWGYSQQDWEDVLQEAYYAVLVNLHTYRENTRFNAWVLEIVKNKAVNYAVKHGKQNLKEMELVIDVLADSDSAPRDLYRQRETSEILTQHLEKLPDQQREAIALFYFEDMPIKAIAVKMGVGESTVKTHLRRGKAQLESSLLAQGGKSEVFYSVAVLPLLVSMLNKDIGAGLFTVPQNIIQAAISSTVGAGAATGTATGATTTAATGTATATAAPEAAAILAYTEVAEAATATTTAATTTAATTTATAAATGGTAAASGAAATGGGVVAKFVALGAATKAAIVTGTAAVVVAGVAVPVYVHNENEKAVAAMEIVQQQEEQSRLEEQERQEEQARLAEQSRIAEEEAARLEREQQERSAAEEAERREAEAEAERIAAEEEAAQQAAAEESAPAAEEPEQAAVVPPTETTDTGDQVPEPSIPGQVNPDEDTRTPQQRNEDQIKIGNPYVGQPEPAGGCPNDIVSNPRWDSSIGGWRADGLAGPVLIDPWGTIYR